MFNLRLLLLVAVYSLGSQASCPKPVTYLTEGSQTPCTGFLFTPEKEAEVRAANLDLGLQRDINAIQEKQLGLLKEDNKLLLDQSHLWRTRAEDSTKKLMESRNTDTWRMFLYFSLGVAATTLITYGVNQ